VFENVNNEIKKDSIYFFTRARQALASASNVFKESYRLGGKREILLFRFLSGPESLACRVLFSLLSWFRGVGRRVNVSPLAFEIQRVK